MIYNTDIYLSETGAAFKERYVELLAQACRPARTDARSPDRRRRLGQRALPGAIGRQRRADRRGTHSHGRAGVRRSAPQQTLLLPEQARLAQIWASALSIDVNEISPHETFFDLGGDSLLAMRVIQQAEQAMGFRVEPRRYVFETLGQLASAAAGTPLDVEPVEP